MAQCKCCSSDKLDFTTKEVNSILRDGVINVSLRYREGYYDPIDQLTLQEALEKIPEEYRSPLRIIQFLNKEGYNEMWTWRGTDVEKEWSDINFWVKSTDDNTLVDETHLEDGSVTAPKIAPGAVTTEKIADESITTEKIVNNALTEEKISESLQEKVNNNVKFIEQTLADEQKEQARKNIGVTEVTQEDVDALPGEPLGPISDNSTPEVQKVNTILGFDANGEVSKVKTIDTEHIATGAVTKEKLADGLQNTIEKLIINSQDCRIPANYWDLLPVTTNDESLPTELPDVQYIDPYGNLFSLVKIGDGEDEDHKVLYFSGLYSDAVPDDVPGNLPSDSYISTTQVIVHKPTTNNGCEIEVSSGEANFESLVADLISNTAAKPLILQADDNIRSDTFWRYFKWSRRSFKILKPAYFIGGYFVSDSIGNAGEFTLITSGDISQYTDKDNFTVTLFSKHSIVNGTSTDCSVYAITITFTNGLAKVPSSYGVVNAIVNLTTTSAISFARCSDKYKSGQITRAVETVYRGGGVFLWNKSNNKIWMKVPWISEAQLTALKAALVEKFPDADSEHIVQVYKSIFETINDPITVGDSIAGYEVIVTGTGLASTNFYFL